MQKLKKDRYDKLCIKMNIIFYSVQSSFYALSYPNDNSTSRKITSLLIMSTSLLNFLKEVRIPEIAFKYFNSSSFSIKNLPPLSRNYYYFLEPNWEEYKFFIHELIKQKYEIWSKEKQLTKEDYYYLDKYLEIIDQGIDGFEIMNNL